MKVIAKCVEGGHNYCFDAEWFGNLLSAMYDLSELWFNPPSKVAPMSPKFWRGVGGTDRISPQIKLLHNESNILHYLANR